MLDVGGGSGVHSISAVRRWSNLRVNLLDRPEVCAVAQGFIEAEHMEDRIRLIAADMWDDLWPPADVHFFSHICNNYEPEDNVRLLRKSFSQLAPGGIVILHQSLMVNEVVGPPLAAASNVIMQLWSEHGRQYSGAELMALLEEAGYERLEVVPTLACFGAVVGRKS